MIDTFLIAEKTVVSAKGDGPTINVSLAGGRELQAVAVCTALSPPASPCGMCRQMLAEFASDCAVLLCGAAPDGEVVRLRLRELLPHAFSPASLRAFAEQQRDQADGGSDHGT